MKILLADDEKTLRVTLNDDLADAGHDVVAVADGDAALDALERKSFDCVLTDLRMPGADGMEVVRAAREAETEVVVLTGAGSVESAVAAMKAGAFDYIQKPFVVDELLLVLKRLQEKQALAGEVRTLRRELEGLQGFGKVVAQSAGMRKVLELARSAAASDATVVIVGESGTGKEVLARAIHEASNRAGGPFVPVSCATFSETLLEDELFGHEKGAFTDAKSARPGVFEIASGGTMLLDDLDDMRLPTQVKLLRVLQEREVVRVGGTKPVPVDIRILVATKVDLWNEVQAGRFREDLYYRLHVVQIDLPPLRERSDDIPLLLAHFLRRLAPGQNLLIDGGDVEMLSRQPWEGNIRQLENAVRRALALRGDSNRLSMEHLLPTRHRVEIDEPVQPQDWSLSVAVREAEKRQIQRALRETGGNRTKAAELLGISRKNLWEKAKNLGIDE